MTAKDSNLRLRQQIYTQPPKNFYAMQAPTNLFFWQEQIKHCSVFLADGWHS